MKILWIVFILLSQGYSEPMRSNPYIIKFDHLEYVIVDKNIGGNPVLQLFLKEEYWEGLFDYSFSYLNQEVPIQIGDRVEYYFVYDILYDGFEVSISNDQNISKYININLESGNKPSQNDKIVFLEKMAIKYNFHSEVISLLIQMYYSLDTLEASQRCINLYEKHHLPDKTTHNIYTELFGCYSDLNQTGNAFKLLDRVEALGDDIDTVSILEKKAFLFTLEKKTKEARAYYQKAIEKIKSTDFFNGIDISDDSKKLLLEISESEILRLKKLIAALDNE